MKHYCNDPWRRSKLSAFTKWIMKSYPMAFQNSMRHVEYVCQVMLIKSVLVITKSNQICILFVIKVVFLYGPNAVNHVDAKWPYEIRPHSCCTLSCGYIIFLLDSFELSTHIFRWFYVAPLQLYPTEITEKEMGQFDQWNPTTYQLLTWRMM